MQEKIVELVMNEFAVPLQILLIDIKPGSHSEESLELADIHHMGLRLLF
jgi:hypothetical protein